ncbi:MAG: mercury methylation ferredoxin HgcB [Desulfocapsaceae bacterium]|nr:mercury methylation ferredoxin HgcB [Desulfocapsaceae bacterium]
MKSFRYIEGVASITVDRQKCVGCAMCVNVCPHQVIQLHDKKANVVDRDGCMECGACATNCPVEAISLTPGVGCASLIINRCLKKRNINTTGCC